MCLDRLQERVIHIKTNKNVHMNMCPEKGGFRVALKDYIQQ
jgi:hypothetical protein